MATVNSICAERLRELLDYDSSTGIFTWRQDRAGRRFAGRIAGSINPKGYREITVDGGRYWAHRLVWLYVHGDWPTEIDHINGDKADNRLQNLRNVEHSENMLNTAARSRGNATGYTGVWKHKRGYFGAVFQVGGRRHHVGYFQTAEAAAEASKAAREMLNVPPRR